MRALGFKPVALGPDGDAARAERLNAQRDVTRKGHKASDQAIIAAGYAGEQIDKSRAEAIFDNIFAWTRSLANSPAALHLAKEMRHIARMIERRAKSAAANTTPRAFLHVGSA
jgi:hypothetical protein